jgi:hypothetical protein
MTSGYAFTDIKSQGQTMRPVLIDPTDMGINNSSTAPPPLSEPMIEVAIEDVPEAGYLRNVSGETTVQSSMHVIKSLHLKTAFQQDGKPETSSSHSKKQRQ